MRRGKLNGGSPHIPVRTCVGCRERAAAAELLRVVVQDGEVVPDPRRVLAGRGAAVHPTLRCLELAERRRAFGRAFRVPGGLGAGALHRYVAGLGDTDREGVTPAHGGEAGDPNEQERAMKSRR